MTTTNASSSSTSSTLTTCGDSEARLEREKVGVAQMKWGVALTRNEGALNIFKKRRPPLSLYLLDSLSLSFMFCSSSCAFCLFFLSKFCSADAAAACDVTWRESPPPPPHTFWFISTPMSWDDALMFPEPPKKADGHTYNVLNEIFFVQTKIVNWFDSKSDRCRFATSLNLRSSSFSIGWL